MWLPVPLFFPTFSAKKFKNHNIGPLFSFVRQVRPLQKFEAGVRKGRGGLEGQRPSRHPRQGVNFTIL
jgi:hypothetical protein